MRGGVSHLRIPKPSAQSPIAKLVQALPSRAVPWSAISGRTGVSPWKTPTHLPGELWGRYWTFAHNGQLTGYKRLPTGRHRPVGDTDSEHAFCWLLDRLEHKYPKRPANFPAMFRYLATLCDELRGLRVLLSDGEFVMTYCSNNLYWLTRRAPLWRSPSAG